MQTARQGMLGSLSDLVAARAITGPLRVAIDGRTASGKTTLARELGEALAAVGRPVIRASVDGFHRPRAERYARGRFSAEGYYFDARDHQAIRRLLLDPLGPGGSRLYRTASFDLAKDIPVDQPAMLAPEDAILIVDGTFLQRPELAGGWDFAIFVAVTGADAARRGIARDARAGEAREVGELYAKRYGPAFGLYASACQPEAAADIVVENEDPVQPVLRRNSKRP